MSFFSPNAFGFLTLIPILILMYILKQRYEEMQISSLYLWHQVINDTEATSPFQKLKRNLLLILQLLILLLCIFALANPYILWNNKTYENIVMVVDTSGSMSSLGEKDIKLEEAKKKAESLIKSLPSGSKLTLISTAKNFKVEVSGSTDKKEVLNKLKLMKPTNSAGNIEDIYSLVKAICDQYKSYRVVYFTDNGVDLKGLNGEVILLGPVRANLSLDYIAEAKTANGLKALVRVTNHSNENSEAEVCLYGEDKLIAIKNETLSGGQTKTIYFDNVPASAKYIYGELTENDGLEADNHIYSIIKQSDAKKILLSAEKNVFLEKALNTLKDIELFKTLPNEKIDKEFDLYIYDNDNQGNVPAKGNMLFVNPQKENMFFKLGQVVGGGKALVETHAATKYMNNSDFVISKFREIDMPYWSNPLLKVNDKSVAFAGELKGQKVAVVGFDLHESDFPLTPEFPIFINNLISFLVDRDTISNAKFNCGEPIDINLLPETEKLYVKNPDGNTIGLSSKYPVKPYEDTNSPGVYEIIQKVGQKQVGKLVAVNFPISESSYNNIIQQNNATNAGESNTGGLNLLNTLLMMALIIIMVEWVAYLKS